MIEFQKYGSYRDFAEVNTDRDYYLFSALAFGDGGITDDLPYPARGLPTDHSSKVSGLFFVEVNEIGDIEAQIDSEEEFKPEEIAKAWGARALEEYRSYGILPGPDWHTPGWLNTPEETNQSRTLW